MGPISFPGLGINNISINPVAFNIFGYGIKWYGIIIACAMLLALIYGMKRAKLFNITVDDLADVVIFGIIFGVIGARLYYVLFYSDGSGTNPYFANPASIFWIWDGGLGIYGGVIAAFLSAFVVCKIKKISVGAMFDIAALGFLIGQAIGRWGNFINQEAYGGPTNLPWRMVVSNAATPVHPCFLYESLWCIIGFIILHIYSKRRKFNGEIFLMYIAWYAFGRFFIESLRSDSLMIGNIKVSMLVAAVFFVVAVALLVYKRTKVKRIKVEQEEIYKPLFDETSKAVAEETAKEADEYDLEDGEEPKEEAAEDGAEGASGEKTGEGEAESSSEEKSDGGGDSEEEKNGDSEDD